MARCRRIKTLLDERRDLISPLPVDLKVRILECLHIRDAARTALLSTHWKDVWLRHGRLVFDLDFFQCVRKCEGDNSISVVNIINNIFLLHAGPVKKFTLYISSDHKPQQCDLDRWCRFLSRNGVEELNISLNDLKHLYKLPVCIVSCRTIKQLKLEGFLIDLPVNAGCIFPGVASLVLENVDFKRSVNGIASSISIPNLEKLALQSCYGMKNFEISSTPKLEILSAIGFMHAKHEVVESRWLTLHLKAIKTLCLSGVLLSCKDVAAAISMSPTVINLQVMKYGLSFGCGKQLTVAMQLLKKSPNLCELDIIAKKSSKKDDKEAASRILEDPDGWFINQDLKMLNTVKIESFSGSPLEMLFVKMLLSKSPALERVVIQETNKIHASMKILRELLSFPRASPKAQLVCMKYKSMYSLVDYLEF